MRLFRLHNISGEDHGVLAEGVEFSDGMVIVSWIAGHTSIIGYPSREEMMRVHTESGEAILVWVQPLLEKMDTPDVPEPVTCAFPSEGTPA